LKKYRATEEPSFKKSKSFYDRMRATTRIRTLL
jgi:hypothetical protein